MHAGSRKSHVGVAQRRFFVSATRRLGTIYAAHMILCQNTKKEMGHNNIYIYVYIYTHTHIYIRKHINIWEGRRAAYHRSMCIMQRRLSSLTTRR
jgi:hypothetical protein